MSRLPKKKSRKIIVEGRIFRWMLHGRNRYYHRAPGIVTISIQEDIEHPGKTLQCSAVSAQASEAEEECGYCNTSIFPSDIEKIIKTGLINGWNPSEGTGTFPVGNLELKQYTVFENLKESIIE